MRFERLSCWRAAAVGVWMEGECDEAADSEELLAAISAG